MRKQQATPEPGGHDSSNDNQAAATISAIRHRSRPKLTVVAPSEETEDPGPSKGAYEVGYKKPPKHTRFKQGQSGNPKGRPKGALSMHTIVNERMAARAPVTINGRKKNLSHAEIAVNQQIKKAITGDCKSLQFLASYMSDEEREPSPSHGSATSNVRHQTELDAVERTMLAHYQGELLRDQGLNEDQVAAVLLKMGLFAMGDE